ATGMSGDELVVGLKEAAESAVRSDLALRALALAQDMVATEEDVDAELARLGEQAGLEVEEVRSQLDQGGQMRAVRSDIVKSKALTWLIDNVTLVDEAGNTINRGDLAVESPDRSDEVSPSGVRAQSDNKGEDEGVGEEPTSVNQPGPDTQISDETTQPLPNSVESPA
ncbi:MAG: hypothetical protein ACRD0E_04670, partial [Acidimicrobiales bacterium]